MIIITEDSSSGYQLWRAIKNTYLKGREDVSLIPAGGIDKIYRVIRDMSERIYNGEKVILAIDMAEPETVRRLLSYIENSGMASSCLLTDYYCSEEVFLSFKYLTEWCAANKFKALCKDIRESILAKRGIDYTKNQPSTLVKFLNEYIKMHPMSTGKHYNREQLASLILTEVTKESGKRFYVSKSTLGKCWWKDCSTVISQTSAEYCERCGLKKTSECRPELAKDKIESLRLYSILGEASIPFKNLVNYK